MTIATSAERRWNRNTTQTSATTMNSSISLSLQIVDRALDEAASGRRSARSRRPAAGSASASASFALTASMVSSAFLPERMTMTPPATSPSPSSSAMPRRISGPDLHARDVAQRTGTPASLTVERNAAEVVERLAGSRDARTMYSASPSSSTEPPVSWLALLHRLDHLAVRDAVGAQPVRIEHDLVLPHHAADARHLGHVRHRLQLVLQEPVLQRAQLRRGPCWPVRSTSAYS